MEIFSNFREMSLTRVVLLGFKVILTKIIYIIIMNFADIWNKSQEDY